MNDYHNISYATIILRNILLQTNEIYLVNHMKVYRESETSSSSAQQRVPDKDYDKDGHAGASSLNEIKYFTQVLYEKLKGCLKFSVENSFNRKYCGVVVKFIRVLCNIRMNDDAFSSVAFELSSMLCEHNFLNGYYHITTDVATTSADASRNQMEKYIQIEIFKFLLLHRVDKSQLINVFTELLNFVAADGYHLHKKEMEEKVFPMVLEKYSNEKLSEEEAKLIFSKNLLNILINSNYSFVVDICTKWKFADVFFRAVLANLGTVDVVSSIVLFIF